MGRSKGKSQSARKPLKRTGGERIAPPPLRTRNRRYRLTQAFFFQAQLELLVQVFLVV